MLVPQGELVFLKPNYCVDLGIYLPLHHHEGGALVG